MRGLGASPTRSMRWPWRGRFLREPDCRWPRTTRCPGSCKLLVDRREVAWSHQRTRDDQQVACGGCTNSIPSVRPDAAVVGSGQTPVRLLRRLVDDRARDWSPSWRRTSSPTSSRLDRGESRRWPSGSVNASVRIAPTLLAMPGCGELTAAKLRGRDRRGNSVQKRGRLRPSCRCGPSARVVRQHRRPGPDDPLG